MVDIHRKDDDEKKEERVGPLNIFLYYASQLLSPILVSMLLRAKKKIDKKHRDRDPIRKIADSISFSRNPYEEFRTNPEKIDLLKKQALAIQNFFSSHGYNIDIQDIHVWPNNIYIDLSSPESAEQLSKFLQDANKYYGGGIATESIERGLCGQKRVVIWNEEGVTKFLSLVDKSKKDKSTYQNRAENKVWEQSAASPAVLPTNSTSLQSGPQISKRKP